jgi:hypothetical protein
MEPETETSLFIARIIDGFFILGIFLGALQKDG